MHISVTRLKLRSPLYLFSFVKSANECVAQAETSPGFQTGVLFADQWFTFWTVTAWDSAATMRAYRDTGAHKTIMPKMANWCEEASVATYEGDRLPEPADLHSKMLELGRSSKVRKPSRNHLSGKIPAIRLWAPPRPLRRRGAD